MVFFKQFYIYILFIFSVCYGDFLALDMVEKEEPPPFLVYGANYTGRIFAGGIDNFGGANARLRINKNWALGAKAEMDFTQSGFVVGAFGHYLLTRELFKEQAENFMQLGLDFIKIEDKQSPIISIGLGRDMLPWKKSPFGFRVLGRLEYTPIAHIFTRTSKGIFGLEMTTLANTDFAIEVGVFMYK